MREELQAAPNMALAAALIADPSRARILSALLGGKAFTAGELARHAGVTAQTCSEHLAKLTAAGFLNVVPQGRHRYFTLSGPAIAHLLESLQVAGTQSVRTIATGPRDKELRYARICYDHLAGTLGVALLERFRADGWVETHQAGLVLTERGRDGLMQLGVELASPNGQGECRECMDWSERRMHLAGQVGALVLKTFLSRDWLRRRKDSRSLLLTGEGRYHLTAFIGDLWD